MEITSSYQVEILSNTDMKNTVQIYRRALAFVIDVCNREWGNISVLGGTKEKDHYVEKLIHPTKNNPNPKYPFDIKGSEFYKFPSYLKRAVIAEAIGAVSSYRSNYKNWEDNGKKGNAPTLQMDRHAMPVFYNKNMYKEDAPKNAKYPKGMNPCKDNIRWLKLYQNNDWVWIPVRLRKTDIDYINKVKLEKEYKERTKTWKDYTREEKSELIMKYVDDIKLGILNNYIYVDNINFRESICKPCNELFDAGYIDVKTPVIFGNIVGQIRFSNYLPEKEIGKHIMRLRQYYDVGFEEATYYVEDRIFYFNFIHDDRAIVRVFPMEDYAKIDPDIKMKEYKYGIIYIRSKDEFQMQDINTAFDYIPDETNDCVIYTKEPVPIEIGIKPVKKELLYEEE